MCFPRKPGLGQYNGSRRQWRAAYRDARIAAGFGVDVPASAPSLDWKAGLIVTFERKDFADALTTPVLRRLATKRLIDEICCEISGE